MAPATTRTDRQLRQALAEITSTKASIGDPLIGKIESLLGGDESRRADVEAALDKMESETRG